MCLFTLLKSAQEDISPSNKSNLKKLNKFCKPSVSFKAMCENLSSLAVLSSYHIFRKRKTLDWDQETQFLKTTSVAEFKEFEPRFKSAKTRFKLSAGLNLETFDTI